MKHNPKFTCTIWRVSLILIILHALPLKGQQIGSAPVITLTSPSVMDSLNNSGLALVKAEIFSKSSLQTVRIFINNGTNVVSETGIKPKQKDSVTYIIESLVALNGGLNIIYLEAKKYIGTTISEKRIITSQLEPFVT